MPPQDVHRPVRQVPELVMEIVKSREELTVVSRKPLAQLTPQRVSIGRQYRYPIKLMPCKSNEILAE